MPLDFGRIEATKEFFLSEQQADRDLVRCYPRSGELVKETDIALAAAEADKGAEDDVRPVCLDVCHDRLVVAVPQRRVFFGDRRQPFRLEVLADE